MSPRFNNRSLRSVVLILTTGALAALAAGPADAAPTSPPAVPLAVVPGGIALHLTSPGGDPVPGAAFTLLDPTGTTAASGTTDTTGSLNFNNLPPGVYHLEQTASSSAAYQETPDQDIIVTQGATATLDVIDPFNPADLTVHVNDQHHRPVTAVKITISPQDPGNPVVSLTTDATGAAHIELPMTSLAGMSYTADEDHSRPVTFHAEPGALVAVTLTDTTAPQTTAPNTPAPTPTWPSPTPTKGGGAAITGSRGTPTPSASPSGTPALSSTKPAPDTRAQLAHTGSALTSWLLGTAGLLMIIGAGALSGARFHRTIQKPPIKQG